jgi:protein-ribulosamine 3-kinase
MGIDPAGQPAMQGQGPAVRFDRPPLRTAVERRVSEHRGRGWRARAVSDRTEYACHPCAILSDGAYAVFAKFSDAADGWAQFEIELAGLRLLSERAGVRTPTPLGLVRVPGGSLLVLEAVQPVDRTPPHWRQIGRTLARIHRIQGERFGLERDGYFGPLVQENTPAGDWPSFYAERRLEPGLRLAVDSGNLSSPMIRQVERLIARLPELCGPEPVPTLLHGDAQQNNFLSTAQGAVVIDPAVYYGHPEMDLAALDCFQPVPDDVFAGYQEERPLDPGFWERRALWRVWAYLAGVAVEGRGYLGKLSEAVQTYV